MRPWSFPLMMLAMAAALPVSSGPVSSGGPAGSGPPVGPIDCADPASYGARGLSGLWACGGGRATEEDPRSMACFSDVAAVPVLARHCKAMDGDIREMSRDLDGYLRSKVKLFSGFAFGFLPLSFEHDGERFDWATSTWGEGGVVWSFLHKDAWQRFAGERWAPGGTLKEPWATARDEMAWDVAVVDVAVVEIGKADRRLEGGETQETGWTVTGTMKVARRSWPVTRATASLPAQVRTRPLTVQGVFDPASASDMNPLGLVVTDWREG